MTGVVLTTNVAVSQPDPGGAGRVSGIDKHPVVSGIEVFAPGPDYGDGSGVRDDVVGDSLHHGGMHKAVYAFEREQLDFWDPSYRNGYFGENLTTTAIDLSSVLINQRFQVGGAVLEVSVPRRPCRTFGAWLERKGWMKTFTAHGQAGAYFRVITPGQIMPGAELVALDEPEHGVTMGMAFRAKMGDKELARRVVDAGCLPGRYHEELVRLI